MKRSVGRVHLDVWICVHVILCGNTFRRAVTVLAVPVLELNVTAARLRWFSARTNISVLFISMVEVLNHQQLRASLDAKACPQAGEELTSFCESTRTLAVLVEEQAPEGPPK